MKAAATLLVVIALGALGVWIAQGTNFATVNQELIETKKTDEFGDEVIHREWKDTFKLGIDIAGPAAGGSLGLAGLLLFLNRRKQKKAAA